MSFILEGKVQIYPFNLICITYIWQIDKVPRIHIFVQTKGDGHPPPQSGRGDHHAFSQSGASGEEDLHVLQFGKEGGGGHPCTLIYILHIYSRYTKYTEYIYLKVKEMATLLLKVEGVTIMPFQLRRISKWRGGHLPSKWRRWPPPTAYIDTYYIAQLMFIVYLHLPSQIEGKANPPLHGGGPSSSLAGKA